MKHHDFTDYSADPNRRFIPKVPFNELVPNCLAFQNKRFPKGWSLDYQVRFIGLNPEGLALFERVEALSRKDVIKKAKLWREQLKLTTKLEEQGKTS